MALLKVAQSAIAVRKFVHQKDMSEHCRRRVVPSVFLGKHVVDANSQILHFSRLQLPYSCSISVRTEFGNNIILVIQLLSDHSLTRSCGPDHSQLLIYELGETFGGYWGGLPDVMMNMESQNHTKFYTLKTTPTTVETSPPKLEEEEEEEVKKDASSHIPLSSPDLKETEEDFIRIEVPLLNVSGDLGVNEISQNKMDVDEFLDLVYDVTPRSDGNYDTSILPLVRFSVRKQTEREDYGPPFKSKYELDYDLGYTPDSRLVKTTLKPRPYFNIKEPTTKLIPTINENILSNIYNNTLQNNKSSWDVIVDLFKSLNTSLKPYIEEITKDVTVAKQNTQRTKNIPLDGSKSSSIQHQVEAVTIKSAFLKNISTTMLGHDSKDTDNNITSFGKDQALQGVTEDEVKVFFTRNDDVDRETGSLVNHKSFENIVQTAPIISVLLNRTNASEPYNSSSPRKKRYIKALEIENARPRVLTTRKSMRRTTEKVYRYSDMQDLAQLVELQDDEMQGRVALRYLRKYVGSPLFNICDYQEPKARQVYLFNSSRIVIAVSNFTMERMTLVVTPARTLLNSVGRCPPAHLECQVAGTRVCIDSTNQCDGVPNCGAYDIYDEDRLRCGWSLGLQHNVCLAACTFLAVISTILYTVHYWLKRCVPRVSEAFFIYADASENMYCIIS
ncbi:unnamed protein product [Leptosia nina]|uniref:CUB domain-containing protein n=1 Tax=Leptosia nina TaxID=320188 RepID=A0AAV1JJ42_9NEOP